MPQPLKRLDIEVDRADESEIVGMSSIFSQAFPKENPKLEQLMYADINADCTWTAFEQIVKQKLHSDSTKFQIAFDCREEFDEDMSYGWISIGIVSEGDKLDSYEASDFSVWLSWEILASAAGDRGEDPERLNANDRRVCLTDALDNQSKDGQFAFVPGPHLVVNGLFMCPDSHNDSLWEMALKLLGWAVTCAKRKNLPIWTQIPEAQIGFFRQAGFIEVGRFALNLNHFTRSTGTDWGTLKWVQMIYRVPPERRARSTSPDIRGARRRRPSV